jgi:hypothetical protein
MMAWRPDPIRQEEIPRDNREKDNRADDPPFIAPTIAEPAREAKAQPPGIVGKIKQLFKDAMKALTGKSAAPKPKRRRKRGEDTRGLFKKLAMKILGPVVRSVFDADDFNWFTPPDELDETQRLLQRELYSQDAIWQHHDNEASHRDQTNHLFPHL